MRLRFLKAIAAALMHLVFGFFCALAWISCWPALVYWVITGDEAMGDDIYGFGKAEDQATNSAVLRGHFKETISSHVGRRYVAYRAGTYTLTWVDKLVWNVTTLFEPEHPIKAIEEPFIGMPL